MSQSPGVSNSASLPEWVISDPMRLRQILINVVGNAAKFTEQGGIELAAKQIPGVRP